MADNDGASIAVPDLKLELVPVPVADVDRARAFYERAGFKLEVDTRPTDTMRVVQFTPPGSACTIVFGTGMGEITDMKPGSVKGLHLVVADIATAREALVKRGVDVGEITDLRFRPTGIQVGKMRVPLGSTSRSSTFRPSSAVTSVTLRRKPDTGLVCPEIVIVDG